MDTAPSSSRSNYYQKDVDFDDLARRDEDWASICRRAKQTRWIDFQDPRVVKQLTKSLLKSDFNISSFDLPDDRLCPPVPVRWNYVRWIQDLLDTTSDNYSDTFDPNREITGLDVGVGASAIYPLLACSTRKKWRMAGTDIDQHSLDFARQNVKSNSLGARIKLALAVPDESLVCLDELGIEELDFVMTNPPFFSSESDMQASYGAKAAAPSAVCTGSANEMICPNGDVGFVTRIIEESLLLRERVQWYTAMLGKFASLQQVVAKLKHHSITNFAVTCLQAGHKTNRWAVAWSFRDFRPEQDVARHGNLVLAVLPKSSTQTINVPLMSASWAGDKVNAILKDLEVLWRWSPQRNMGVMRARENVWNRAARRRKSAGPPAVNTEATGSRSMEKKTGGGQDASSSEEDEEVALAVKITCKQEQIDVRWLQGHDHIVFESFCGMLKRGALAAT